MITALDAPAAALDAALDAAAAATNAVSWPQRSLCGSCGLNADYVCRVCAEDPLCKVCHAMALAAQKEDLATAPDVEIAMQHKSFLKLRCYCKAYAHGRCSTRHTKAMVSQLPGQVCASCAVFHPALMSKPWKRGSMRSGPNAAAVLAAAAAALSIVPLDTSSSSGDSKAEIRPARSKGETHQLRAQRLMALLLIEPTMQATEASVALSMATEPAIPSEASGSGIRTEAKADSQPQPIDVNVETLGEHLG